MRETDRQMRGTDREMRGTGREMRGRERGICLYWALSFFFYPNWVPFIWLMLPSFKMCLPQLMFLEMYLLSPFPISISPCLCLCISLSLSLSPYNISNNIWQTYQDNIFVFTLYCFFIWWDNPKKLQAPGPLSFLPGLICSFCLFPCLFCFCFFHLTHKL